MQDVSAPPETNPSLPIGDKVRAVRNAHDLGRQAFCLATDIPKQTLINVETRRNDPSYRVLHKIVRAFPQYTLWLMLDQTLPHAGQIQPATPACQQNQAKLAPDP